MKIPPRPEIASWLGTGQAVGATARATSTVVWEKLTGRLDVHRADWQIEHWAHAMIRAASATVIVRGELPPQAGGPYIYMSNHPSLFDIIALHAALPPPLRMVAKDELLHVPLLGPAMRASGYVGVQRRGNPQEAKAAMAQVATVMRSTGASFWLAPEGTRSDSDAAMGPFKKGGFIWARELGAKIVPVALRGTGDVHAKGAARLTRGKVVHVVVGQPIDPSGQTLEQSMAAVRAALQHQLDGVDAAEAAFVVG